MNKIFEVDTMCNNCLNHDFYKIIGITKMLWVAQNYPVHLENLNTIMVQTQYTGEAENPNQSRRNFIYYFIC